MAIPISRGYFRTEYEWKFLSNFSKTNGIHLNFIPIAVTRNRDLFDFIFSFFWLQVGSGVCISWLLRWSSDVSTARRWTSGRRASFSTSCWRGRYPFTAAAGGWWRRFAGANWTWVWRWKCVIRFWFGRIFLRAIRVLNFSQNKFTYWGTSSIRVNFSNIKFKEMCWWIYLQAYDTEI